jgi:hypothetical protein
LKGFEGVVGIELKLRWLFAEVVEDGGRKGWCEGQMEGYLNKSLAIPTDSDGAGLCSLPGSIVSGSDYSLHLAIIQPFTAVSRFFHPLTTPRSSCISGLQGLLTPHQA